MVTNKIEKIFVALRRTLVLKSRCNNDFAALQATRVRFVAEIRTILPQTAQATPLGRSDRVTAFRAAKFRKRGQSDAIRVDRALRLFLH